MWRFVTILLLLFFLAQNANASSISTLSQNKFSLDSNVVQLDQQANTTVDDQDQRDLFNLPRINSMSPATFSVEAQTAPNYVLIIEFFTINTNERAVKNLASPVKLNNWFEQLNHRTKSSRISGWKDGNFLYSAQISYHS